MVVDGEGKNGGSKIARRLHTLSNDNMTDAERAFTQKLRSLGNFEKIEISGLGSLRSAFEGAASEDPYYISPAYYGLTGRRGLWAFIEDEDTALLFCLHPNLRDTVIIFPPFAGDSQKALQDFLNVVKGQPLTFQIGRVQASDQELIQAVQNIKGFKAEVVKEEVLDWKYPVPTIDLARMHAKEGPQYSALRQALNSIERKFNTNDPDKSRLATRMINFQSADDGYEIAKLARAWERSTQEKHHHRQNYNVDSHLYFKHLTEMGKNPQLNLRGMFLILDGVPQGFSIWEAPVGRSKIANVFASQVAVFNTPSNQNDSTPHFTTGLLYKTGRQIQMEGGRRMCLGGSETEGQYRFKAKFVPEISSELVTISLVDEAQAFAVTGNGIDSASLPLPQMQQGHDDPSENLMLPFPQLQAS